jgi:hypothetical protein
MTKALAAAALVLLEQSTMQCLLEMVALVLCLVLLAYLLNTLEAVVGVATTLYRAVLAVEGVGVMAGMPLLPQDWQGLAALQILAVAQVQ